MDRPLRVLVTAGPTREPIDAVRFVGNRSSGRMGVALADAAADLGCLATLLLGPCCARPANPAVIIRTFERTSDLAGLLRDEFATCDVLVMAAAVADYSPQVEPGAETNKRRRTEQNLILELHPTPDLLAECSRLARHDQYLVGFALEAERELTDSALAKLARKGVDLIVANPLKTMDSDAIEATLFHRDGALSSPGEPLTKPEFARWLMPRIIQLARSKRDRSASASG